MKSFLTRSLSVITGVALFASMAAMPVAFADVNHDNGHGKDDAKLVGSTFEVHISDNGQVLVRGAKVTAVAGNSITATNNWGSASLTWIINTDTNTQFIRKNGGASNIGEVSVNDIVSFKGALVTTASVFTVNASIVKDFSIQKTRATINGTVQSIASSSFMLSTHAHGNVTVNTTSSTVIKKDDATATFADIIVGANVSASGVLDTQANTLAADSVKIQVPKPAPATLQGTIKSVAGTTAPTTFVLTVGSVDYTVSVAADTSVLNNLWLHTALVNLHVGDTVRVYGTVDTTTHTISATVVRDTSISI